MGEGEDGKYKPDDAARREPVEVYTIPPEEFEPEKAPKNPTKWKESERVTRENFTDFLVTSFRLSLGISETQYAFFDWIKRKNGFDISTIFEIPKDDDSLWDCLSQEEQDFFYSQFSGVSAHQRGETLTGMETSYKISSKEDSRRERIRDEFMSVSKNYLSRLQEEEESFPRDIPFKKAFLSANSLADFARVSKEAKIFYRENI